MIALLFLPGVVTKLSHGVQVEKMKKVVSSPLINGDDTLTIIY